MSSCEGEMRPLRTRVKVCGITTADDALCAQDAGADAIGVILVPSSPRYLGDRLHEIELIRRACGPFLTLVAVVQDLADLQAYPVELFDAVQYYENVHDHRPPARLRRILALRGASVAPGDPRLDGVSAVVLDTYHPRILGGTGQTGDWVLAKNLVQELSLPVVLAGGLTPANVAEAVETVQPYGVDVSSGVEVEAEPGRKDLEKLRRFIQAVQRADDRLSTPPQEEAHQ